MKAVDMAWNSELERKQIKDLQFKKQQRLDNMDFLVSNTVIAKPKDTNHDGGCKLRIKTIKISFSSVCPQEF